ncbi:MAG: thiamine pyrophosphate-dependent enzyme [Planctomycetota bacterium]
MTEECTHYCPGCGHGTVHRLLAEVFDELDIRRRTVGIAPVGCAVLAYNYIDIDWTEAAHGRPPAVATGLKRVNPDNIVFTYQGDGDLASIGMAETIHCANRGENVTVVFLNNAVYGMTQGQMAPTTLVGQKTTTTPRGRSVENEGPPIRICELLNSLDAPRLLARGLISSPREVRKTKQLLQKAFQNQIDGVGYSLVEILSPCPTYWRMSPSDCFDHINDNVTETFPPGIIRDEA